MAILGKRRKGAEEAAARILDVTASIEGSLIFQEPVELRISGRFEGTLETRGSLTIGEKAFVKADITGETITVAGRVSGKVVAKRSLKLTSTALLTGEVWTPLLEVEQGAQVEGAIHAKQEAGLPASGPAARQEGRVVPLPPAAAERQEGWMTVAEVAEYLEVEGRIVEQWARERKIPVVQEGAQWRFEKSRIDEWVATQKSS
ncbi:MAG: polymer-forming cytoskeletal protein [Candidatus Omnitrophica bacterium]|nr:polymer-forming cytoskeletal protein [Candidatus Omnitrophota bacterium]